MLGTRALQISMNAPVMVDLDGETDPKEQVCDANNVRVTEGECDGETFKDWTSLGVVFFGIFLLGIGVSFYFLRIE